MTISSSQHKRWLVLELLTKNTFLAITRLFFNPEMDTFHISFLWFRSLGSITYPKEVWKFRKSCFSKNKFRKRYNSKTDRYTKKRISSSGSSVKNVLKGHHYIFGKCLLTFEICMWRMHTYVTCVYLCYIWWYFM